MGVREGDLGEAKGTRKGRVKIIHYLLTEEDNSRN